MNIINFLIRKINVYKEQAYYPITDFKFYSMLVTLYWSRVLVMMIDKLVQEMFPYSPFKMMITHIKF